MTQEDYRAAFNRAKDDFNRAYARKERAELDLNRARVEVMRLRRAVVALAALCGEEGNIEIEFGVTDAIRVIFQEPGRALTLREIKSEMESLGVPLSTLKNPDASIQSALIRLTSVEFLTQSTRRPEEPGQRPKFEWKRKMG